MSAENWRPVVGYEGCYEVSDRGNVRSLMTFRGNPGPRLMATTHDQAGYVVVPLWNRAKGRQCPARVHRLVMESFVGPLPEGLVTRHLNGDKSDNRLANLAYGTHSENLSDQVAHGTHVEANKTHCPQGHEYTPMNTRINKPKTRGPFRMCRTCENAGRRARRAQQRAERAAA